MKKGCLIFAFNNNVFDYVRLANFSAKNIKRHLDLPTSIITDKEIEFDHEFDEVVLVDKPNSSQRLFLEIGNAQEWINGDRCNAFDLSPYNETILLDADYVVSSDRLNTLFKANANLLYHKYSCNIVGDKVFEQTSNCFGVYSMPMSWATVMFFNKSKYANTFFNTMQMIQQNYKHYSEIFNFASSPYRNDYALSIADNLLNGHYLNNKHEIPWNLMAALPNDYVVKLAEDTYEILYNDKTNRVVVKNHDIHVMGKINLRQIYEY